jgi:cell division septal protein FtsQ
MILRRRGTDFERRLRRARRQEWQRQAVERRRAKDAPPPRERRWRLSTPALRVLTLLGVAAALGIGAAATPAALRLGRAAGSWLRDDVLALRTLSVEGASRVPAAEVAAASGLVAGVSLLDVRPEAVAARLRAEPWIADARALRLPPSRVLLAISEKVPRAVVLTSAGGSAWLVDANGEAFAPAAPGDVERLPHVVAAGTPIRPRSRSAALASAVELERALQRDGFATPFVIELPAPGDPQGLAVRLAEVPARVVVGQGELDQKLERLARLLEAQLPETATAGTIDLRFADQAVLRSAASPEGAPRPAAAPGGAPPRTGRSG